MYNLFYMLNLFYQKNTLDDTLIINVSLGSISKVENNNDVVIGYDKDQLRFINVFNASNYFKNIKNGLLFPTTELLNQINNVTKIDLSKYFDNGFRVGLVEKCEEIKGTHLHKCVVDIKTKKLDIVCGAPNCRQGLKVVVATSGTMLPRGKLIVPGALLGNKSEGMLCSHRELNLSKDTRGIVELDDKYIVGDYFDDVYVNKKEH